MRIEHVDIRCFRALDHIDVPMRPFSVLIGENDVGKTSLLYALDKFFAGKKLNDRYDWFNQDTTKPIEITVTFINIDDDELTGYTRSDGTIVLRKVFEYNTSPACEILLDDGARTELPKQVNSKWFGQERFHLVPVRRDLAVQFSMNKTALLGKTLRARMNSALGEGLASSSLDEVKTVLAEAMSEPRITLERFVQEQMHDEAVQLAFADLDIDPVDGVSFSVLLSDDRIEGIPIQNRGAGTQNNLIIALFRLVAQHSPDSQLILAMEEPENSLHPKAQRQLLAVLQEIGAKTQVIVTTHSPVFIDRSRFENNIILTRTTGGKAVARTLAIEMLEVVRADLGIRASDALLKGGGNCALLVEGRTEEDGFPTFMEMCGLSEFHLGISIINMQGSDFQTVRNIAQLLKAYDVPCVIVLDRDATQTAEDLERMRETALENVREIYVLKKGNIEDYFPLDVVAEVINTTLSPSSPVAAKDFDPARSGAARLDDFSRVMHNRKCGSSVRFLKTQLGGLGARLLKERGMELDPELKSILMRVKKVAGER